MWVCAAELSRFLRPFATQTPAVPPARTRKYLSCLRSAPGVTRYRKSKRIFFSICVLFEHNHFMELITLKLFLLRSDKFLLNLLANNKKLVLLGQSFILSKFLVRLSRKSGVLLLLLTAISTVSAQSAARPVALLWSPLVRRPRCRVRETAARSTARIR